MLPWKFDGAPGGPTCDKISLNWLCNWRPNGTEDGGGQTGCLPPPWGSRIPLLWEGRGGKGREEEGSETGRSRMETDGQVSARKWAKLSELESIGGRADVV